MYAMVAAECGNENFAYRYFMKTATIDLEATYKVYVGTIFMGGSHPAANGGAWMTAIFGFGGVKAFQHFVTINPRLYKMWNQLQFKLMYKGDHFCVTITHRYVEVSSDPSNKDTHRYIISGASRDCKPGETIHVIIQQ
jgi:kojibiose phosphorylase